MSTYHYTSSSSTAIKHVQLHSAPEMISSVFVELFIYSIIWYLFLCARGFPAFYYPAIFCVYLFLCMCGWQYAQHIGATHTWRGESDRARDSGDNDERACWQEMQEGRGAEGKIVSYNPKINGTNKTKEGLTWAEGNGEVGEAARIKGDVHGWYYLWSFVVQLELREDFH